MISLCPVARATLATSCELGRKDRQYALHIAGVESFAIIRFRHIDCIDVIHMCQPPARRTQCGLILRALW